MRVCDFAVGIMVSMLLAVSAAAAPVRPKSDRSVESVIREVCGPTQFLPNLSGEETEVELRYVGFSPKKADERMLMAAFRKKTIDLTARLCLASYLVRLENKAGRDLILQCLEGKHVERSLDDPADAPGDSGLTTEKQVKENAAYALRYAAADANDWAVKEMLRVVQDELVSARSQAFLSTCNRLGELKAKEAVEVLMKIVERNPGLSEPAVALGEIGDPRAEAVLLKTVEQNGRLVNAQAYALHKLNSQALVPILLRHLDSNMATLLLVTRKERRAIEPLRARIRDGKDESGDARLALARIESMNQRELASRLLKLLGDDAFKQHRWRAIEPLGKTRDPSAIGPLVDLAKTCTSQLEWSSSITALETIGKQAVPGLISLFDRDFTTLRRWGKPSSIAVQERIAVALEKLTGEKHGTNAAKWRAWLESP